MLNTSSETHQQKNWKLFYKYSTAI